MEKTKIIDLVEKSQNGDKKALNCLINEIYNDLYYYILKTVKDENLAADITQESCIEIITTINNLKSPEAFSVWSKRIAFHQCTRYFRKRKDILAEENEDGETIFDELVDESQDALPEQVLEDKEFRKTIMDMINSLTSEQSNALLLYYYEKMSVKQIADIQGTTEGTIKSRLNYARKAIKSKVEEYEERTGTRLHSVAILPLLLRFVFGAEKSAIPALSVPATVTAAASATATAAGTTVAGATATTATAAAAKGAGSALAAKIIAGVLAASLIVGGTGFGVSKLLNKGNNGGKGDSGDVSDGTMSLAPSEGLEYQYIDEDEFVGYVVTGKGSFEGKDLVIPSEHEGEPVIGVDNSAFENSDIASLTLPKTIQNIGSDAFINCDSLKEAVIVDNCVVGPSAFEDSDSLEKVTIGKNCKIDKKAFSNCDSLSQVNFPDTYFELNHNCFENCPSLTYVDLDFVCIIDDRREDEYVVDNNRNVITPYCEISESAFDDAIIFDNLYFDISYFENDEEFLEENDLSFNNINSRYKTIHIPDAIRLLDADSFRDATCEFNYEGTVEQWNAIKWEEYHDSCEAKSKPLSIDCIDGVVEMYPTALHDYDNYVCTACGSKYQSKGIEYILSSDGSYALVSSIYYCSEEDTYIAETYKGLPVIGIVSGSNHVLMHAGSIKTLHFHEGFEYISRNSFASLEDLEAIYLPSTLKSIDYDAFRNADNLTDVYYSGTVNDWEKIELHSYWISNIASYTVHCTDGDIYVE